MDQQPSVASFFQTRKRTSPEQLKIRANKVLVLDSEDGSKGPASLQFICDAEIKNMERNVSAKDHKVKLQSERKKQLKAAIQKKIKDSKNQPVLQDLFIKMVQKNDYVKMDVDPEEHLKTPPASPTKRINLMDNLREPTLKDIKDKITKSSRLADLKASLARFKQGQDKLDKKPEAKGINSTEISTKKEQIANTLNTRKESVAKKSLFRTRSSENLVDQKTSFNIPYKYRTLAEIFRSIDTVCQIMHNRKETITFRHLKPALEELLKKNVKLSHLAQLKTLYPEAYNYRQEKIRSFGAGINQEKWELVIVPNVEESMTSQVLLERRRNLYNIIIEKIKVLHAQFLLTLSPPIVIAKENLKRWHPEFDIEKIADVELADLPEAPYEEKLSTGKEVLEKVKAMFNCNTRMETALDKLKKAQETDVEKPKVLTSVLKGIPKALLEKVRQKQAAKALEAMTRCEATEKELKMYARLPELVKLTRNIFVGEKKSVLPVDTVLDKLVNSVRTYMHKPDIEKHLRIIAKEVPTWMVFHTVRNGVFIKILKDANIMRVCDSLAEVLKQKRSAKAL